MHHKSGLNHLIRTRQVQPNLKQLQRVRLVVVFQREHLAVNDTRARRHVLQIPIPVPPGVPVRVAVIDRSFHHRRYRLESSMRVLREAGNLVAVVHSVRLFGVKVSAVPAPRRLQFRVAGRVEIFVVDAEQKRIARRHGRGNRYRVGTLNHLRHDGARGRATRERTRVRRRTVARECWNARVGE